jgi:anaerobic carbon-monoxide dehydrogenase iron sulfur subunit
MTRKKNATLLVDPEKCTGCRLCEMACSMAHHGILNPQRARIRVLRFAGGRGHVPVVCQACEDAPCIKTCPMNARIRTAGRAVVTDADRCIGCRACAYICPFGAPVVNPDDGKTLTCDLCEDEEGRPWCVRACRDCGALQLVDAGETSGRKSRQRAAQARTAYRPKKGAGACKC